MAAKKGTQSSRKKAPETSRLPEKAPEIHESAAFWEIAALLSDSEPVELPGLDGPVRVPGYTQSQKIERLEVFLRDELRRRRRPRKGLREQPSGTPRQLEALSKRAAKLGEDARRLLPATHDFLFRSLADLEFAARERAESLLWMKSRGHPRPSGRRLQRETEILAVLDIALKEIPAKRRRGLMAALLRETLGVNVKNAEQVRQRLKDYRLKPGRSPQ